MLETTRQDQRCIDLCYDCARICERCSVHCLHMGRGHAAPEHQCILRDCAEVCLLLGRMLGRGSPHAAHIRGECAEICVSCAESCEAMAGGDPMMMECAELCKQCAWACDAS